MAEAAVRVARPASDAWFTESLGTPVGEAYTSDPVLGWRTVPGADIQVDRERLAWESERGIALDRSGEVPVSPEGFRDTPLTHPRPADEVRVLCLGDSSVWGHGVGRLDTFAQRVEAAIGGQLQMINAGVPGYSSYQSLALLEEARGLGLDGLVIYSMFSDVFPTEGPTDSEHFGRPWALTAGRLLFASALYRWLRPQVLTLARSAQPRARNRVPLADYRANLARFVAAARADDAWIVFMVPPLRNDAARPAPPAPITGDDARALAARLEGLYGRDKTVIEHYRLAMHLTAWEAGAPVVNGPALIAAAPERASELFVDPVHPSPEGHRILADALEPLVRERLPR